MEELRFSEYCANCRKSLANVERVLFVEKEVGRCFCSEECIKDYFQPTVEFMQEEFEKLRSDHDFSAEEASKLAHYRLLTLEDPDEVWMDHTETGERHFTFISHFRHGEERFSYVVVCLTIDGQPSFLFLTFPTRDDDLVDDYRRGKDLKISDEPENEAKLEEEIENLPEPDFEAIRGTTEEMNDFERLYAEHRRAEDIPHEDFKRFEQYVEPTLDDPDEIWTFVDQFGDEWFTFMARHTDDEEMGFTMIVVCQQDNENGRPAFQVVFPFPTIDPALIQCFRKGINSLNKSFGMRRTGWAA